MPSLHSSFRPEREFQRSSQYSLLPLRFSELDEHRTVFSSIGGDYLVVPRDIARAFLNHELLPDSAWADEFESRHLAAWGDPRVHREFVAAQYRTRFSRLPHLTALHMFVVTLRCDAACQYCQVSRVTADRLAYDMSIKTADRAIDLMLRSPSPTLKVEFQGGESLLNFPLIRHIVLETKRKAPARDVEFVVATNLVPLTDEMLEFFREHTVFISTSLDGPAALHNANRPRPDGGSYDRVVRNIDRCRTALGQDSVSALMTCTERSLDQPEAIVDEYAARGFQEIFLRSLSPYGFAAKSGRMLGYDSERFVRFYERGLRRVLHHNLGGVRIREAFAAIVLRKLLTPFPTGFVDLQSPAGLGLGALVYNYDGNVYASDEGRMLAEMGDSMFQLGNVHRDSWDAIWSESQLLPMLHASMAEGIPGCTDCAFLPFCGSDPVRHHATQGDVVGHRPTSSFCRRVKGIIRLLISTLEDEPEAARVLRRWAR